MDMLQLSKGRRAMIQEKKERNGSIEGKRNKATTSKVVDLDHFQISLMACPKKKTHVQRAKQYS